MPWPRYDSGGGGGPGGGERGSESPNAVRVGGRDNEEEEEEWEGGEKRLARSLVCHRVACLPQSEFWGGRIIFVPLVTILKLSQGNNLM